MSRLIEKCINSPQKKIVVGFDGFVDTIVRPASKTDAFGNFEAYFSTIDEFGSHLIQQANKSCSIELDVVSTRLGGNAPLLSMGASSLGMDCTCIGMLGKPMSAHNIDPVFDALPCRKFSFMPAGTSTALEFQDGKVLLAPRVTAEGDLWQLVLDTTEGKCPELLVEADAAAFVNWSELSFSHALWERAYNDFTKTASPEQEKYILFDLCDCERKPDEQIDAVLSLIGRFSAYRTGILSLNENEALIIGNRILKGVTNLAQIALRLREQYEISEVLIHTTTQSILSSPSGIVQQPSIYVECPKISTGAGDHFNAAYCYSSAVGLNAEERIEFCHLFVHSYIKNGKSPTLEDLTAV